MPFSLGTFDGMTDCYQYNSGEGRLFTDQFGGARWVFTSRSYSDTLIETAIRAVATKYHATGELPTAEQFKGGELWKSSPMANFIDPLQQRYWTWESLIRRQIAGELED
jgi:hypothetical protein